MKIVIIGSVAAGTSVAAKARRNTEEAQIVLYDKDVDISYSICGIPYAIGDEVGEFSELTPRSAPWFKKRYNVDIHTSHEVTKINHENKTLEGLNLLTNEPFTDTYDVLVFATGSSYHVPEVFAEKSFENVFSVRNIQSGKTIHTYLQTHQPKSAVVVGAGFIGLEMAEQLKEKGLDVTLLQRGKFPMSHLDWDMSIRVTDEIVKNGIDYRPEETVAELIGEQKLEAIKTTKGNNIQADLFILATGVKPNTRLAESIGVKLGTTGAIQTNEKMQTNLPDVYAVGDVAESFHVITKKPIYRPLASTANKMGRIAGDVITGGNLTHQGILGTGILRFFDTTIAQTGLTEFEALNEGYDLAVLYNLKPNKPDYMHGKEMVIKAIADKKTDRILGAQIIGKEGVDKRIDVLATAISYGAKANELFHLDLAYAPPFSTTKDPIHYTGMALDNAIQNQTPLMTPIELIKRKAMGEKLQIIDTRSAVQYEKSNVADAVNIPLAQLREKQADFDKELTTIVYCNSGVTGNAAQHILMNAGFTKAFNLSGGNKNYQEIMKNFDKFM
ncbi:MAG: FAD-dependent oxidoreductase [Streptococcaceae bacterium]|jgi:NADPH-dependent 2,4-dienoyl-CoA reductase/sulfur reductase-like enzyme/rhodanese-related sulfurtransferase|nr:FAD-dependent oxidoreductase [Streptococcaceae bacterium]